MTYYELEFRLQHECPYCAFSREHPSVVISHWCNWSRDVLEFFHAGEPGAKVRRDIRRLLAQLGSRPIRDSQVGPHERVVIQHCSCDALPPPTLPAIEKRNCLNLQPMVYTGGWERYRIAAFSDQDIRQLFRDLERCSRVDLVSRKSVVAGSVHESLMISTTSLLGGLTEKQARAIVTALDQGYYQYPRRANSVEIARRVGTPRTSFVDHLRKGQNKVMAAIGPYLRIHATTAS